MTALVSVLLQVKGAAADIEAFRAKHLVEKDGKPALTFEGARSCPEELKGLEVDLEVIDGKPREVAWRTRDGQRTKLSNEEFKELQDRYAALGDAEWRRLYWGTVEDAGCCSIEEQRTVDISFSVPRFFPLTWYGQLVRMHPELAFVAQYDDCASGVSGQLQRSTRPPLNEIYELVDAVAQNQAHPETFQIAPEELRANVKLGDHVKVIFRNNKGKGHMGGERMWLIVEAIDADGKLYGRLINYPLVLEDAEFGDAVEFERRHIHDITENDGPIP